jgi:hypothetical protein
MVHLIQFVNIGRNHFDRQQPVVSVSEIFRAFFEEAADPSDVALAFRRPVTSTLYRQSP